MQQLPGSRTVASSWVCALAAAGSSWRAAEDATWQVGLRERGRPWGG